MVRECFLGIDLGTSSIRAVMFDAMGEQIAIESIPCSILSNLQGFAELSAETVFTDTLQVIRGCVAKSKIPKNRIYGLGFSCHMHSLMAVDQAGEPLTRVMTWADTRAVVENEFVREHSDGVGLYQKTGCVGHPMYPINKLLWLKKNEPGIFNQATRFITIKEYILYKLFGETVVDYTLASSQGYFNLHTLEWDKSILQDVLGIRLDQLSSPVECTYQLKHLKKEYAFALGLNEGVIGVIGSGDGIMANLGSGVFNSLAISSTIGTSGAIRTTVERPLLDPKQRTWCYAFTKEQWVAGGAINNGGLVLKWLSNTFKEQFQMDASLFGETSYQLFDRYAAETPVGSEGLIFLPYLTGERSPDWNAHVRGMMFGLDYSHTKKHIIRAAMEGVMFRLFSVYEAIEQLSGEIVEIKANGGYIQSEIWLQMQADLFHKEIHLSRVSEASALGAAFLTMVSLGYADFHTPLPIMSSIKSFQPNEENHANYRKAYQQAQSIYVHMVGK